jgi:hypothetical protein
VWNSPASTTTSRTFSPGQVAGDLDAAGVEGVGVAADLFAVEVDDRRKIQCVEDQPGALAGGEPIGGLRLDGRFERAPVEPNRLLHPASGQVIQPFGGLGQHAVADQVEADIAGNLRRDGVGEVGARPEQARGYLPALPIIPGQPPGAVERDVLGHGSSERK